MVSLDDRYLSPLTYGEQFTHLRPHRIILISRQRHRSQNPNNRHNDHQFNQRKTLLPFHIYPSFNRSTMPLDLNG